MAMHNPEGRANYEPNCWGADRGAARGSRQGLHHLRRRRDAVPRCGFGPKSFADHYSQARQFFISQTPIEQKHIGDALVFELSKCERPDIRSRIVSHLLNVDATLAARVAEGLRLDLPEPAQAAKPTMTGLPVSEPLSILKHSTSFEGRKLGILVTDGADALLVKSLIKAVHKAKALYEIVAPHIGGAILSDGSTLVAAQKIEGGPSVLYDAVAIVASDAGGGALAMDSAARDFVSDAFAHCKFMGYTHSASTLLQRAGIAENLDGGCITLASEADATFLIKTCAKLRYWSRELAVDLDA